MNAQELKDKWGKDIGKDTQREMDMDEQRLDRCQYRIQYEPYSWCDLLDNKCAQDTGNSLFDTECEIYNDFLAEDK